MDTIKIFLASSAELEIDRKAFEIFLSRENDIYIPKGIRLKLEIWENFIDAISATRLQDEYNKKIQESDIFIMLFFTKVGMYTSEEFDKALEQFKAVGKPLIYTYFKNAHIKFGELNRKDANSVWDFQDKLKILGHFQTVYENQSDLMLHFKQQADKLFAANKLGTTSPQKETAIPKCLSAGEPGIPPGFLGRDTELGEIKERLGKYKQLLVYAEGGMGKTTLTAKYLASNQQQYAHYAWLFCDSGIVEQIIRLAGPLGVDLKQYTDEEQQLLAIKTAMQNLPNNSLLILDNANNPEHIHDFLKIFGGLQWHILFTSRSQQVLPKENEYSLAHLHIDYATQLFKANHNENTPEFENLLPKFLKAVGYNTLIIEIFSKNLHKLSALGETLEGALNEFKEKGIFLGEKSFEIQTGWTGNTHKEAATTDQVLEMLYDITNLPETDRHLMVNLALLPAESQTLQILIDVFTPTDKLIFAKKLRVLAQKGWLIPDLNSYRMSPVLQQIILVKNKDRLSKGAERLIKNLNYKLEFEQGVFLVNLKSFSEARPFAEIANTVTGFLHDETFGIASLLFNISDYYHAIGNFTASLKYLDNASEKFKNIDKENYGVCLERLGSIYQEQGDFKKALQFFELRAQLGKELFEANPHSESLKNGLAISYSKLGSIYQQQGDFKKALQFFELDLNLTKELFEANPHSESLKNGLAISYSKLGSIYQQQGDFKKALQFFELRAQLGKELFEANPHSESLKNGLAISYEKLGSIYQQQGDFKKALQFFELDLNLTKELFEANPHSEPLKYGLAISYEKLGSIYQQQGDFKKALQFFELRAQLGKELFEANPHSESLKNGLAISYEKLGDIYQEQGDFKKALQFFELDLNLTKELFEANPYSEPLKNGLAISYSKLGSIYQQQGDFKKALQFFELQTDLFKELFEANRHSVGLYNGLAVSYTKLGRLYEEMKKSKRAKEYFKLAENIWVKLTEAVPEVVEYQNNLGWVRGKLI